jgi:NADP-dependent 3-hydroxy acid dehydrogenase YdfG
MGQQHRGAVIVTGGSSGIGASIVETLLASGHSVVATARTRSRLDELEQRLGRPAALSTIVADVSDWDDNVRVVAHAVDTFGGLHGAIANAGYTTPGDVRTADPRTWPDLILANLAGPAFLARAALEALEASGGRLVLLGSVAGHKHSPGNIYSAAKWGVVGMAENLRMVLSPSGVGVTLLSPGVVDTPFYPNGIPIESALDPADVARAVDWVLQQPAGVDVNTLVLRPLGQAF